MVSFVPYGNCLCILDLDRRDSPDAITFLPFRQPVVSRVDIEADYVAGFVVIENKAFRNLAALINSMMFASFFITK